MDIKNTREDIDHTPEINLNYSGESKKSMWSSWFVWFIIIVIIIIILMKYSENWCKPKKGKKESPVCKVSNAIGSVVKTVAGFFSSIWFYIIAGIGGVIGLSKGTIDWIGGKNNNDDSGGDNGGDNGGDDNGGDDNGGGENGGGGE
jgi:uncharacterized membrane protein YgcG